MPEHDSRILHFSGLHLQTIHLAAHQTEASETGRTFVQTISEFGRPRIVPYGDREQRKLEPRWQQRRPEDDCNGREKRKRSRRSQLLSSSRLRSNRDCARDSSLMTTLHRTLKNDFFLLSFTY